MTKERRKKSLSVLPAVDCTIQPRRAVTLGKTAMPPYLFTFVEQQRGGFMVVSGAVFNSLFCSR